MKKLLIFLAIIVIAFVVVNFMRMSYFTAHTLGNSIQKPVSPTQIQVTQKITGIATSSPTVTIKPKASQNRIKFLKDVGEAYMDHFGLAETDFKLMQQAGVNVIEGNFDICASDEDVGFFLSQAGKYGMKVVMPAGSGEAEWSYQCDKEPYPADQKPVWNKAGVVDFINKWKNNPAIYAWDTSNEAGSVLPNANPDTYENMLNLYQLEQAYRDVKAADPTRPVLTRQNGWFYYDNSSNFFRTGNPYSSGVADIVMVNAYSNVADYYSDFVTTVATRSINAIYQTDPYARIIISLGAWSEPPLWFKPSESHLKQDLGQLKAFSILGVAYFKYGAQGSEWYLPKQAAELWPIIAQFD